MVKIFLSIVPTTVLFANEGSSLLNDYAKEMALLLSALLVLLSIFLIVQYKELKKTKNRLTEKEEKIAWLRQIRAQNEHQLNQNILELERKVMQQTHTIEKLETKLKEGTKNQVVAKIEELQAKREAARKRIGS